MNRFSYRERDYAFGQLMLTLRARLKLTQAELAGLLGVKRRAVLDWEGGLSYPRADHLQQFVALTINHQVWPAGREAGEVRALWKAAHQKVLLDEAWLGALLSHRPAPVVAGPSEEPGVTAHTHFPPDRVSRRADWRDAPDVANFYGRESELDLLATWISDERCRVVSILGQGGIGKSALATKAMHRLAPDFESVIWRSLRDIPTCEALLDSCLQTLACGGYHTDPGYNESLITEINSLRRPDCNESTSPTGQESFEERDAVCP